MDAIDGAMKNIEIGAKITCLLELKVHVQKQIEELEEQKNALNNNRNSTKE